MRKSVINKVVITASLGFALFFSGQARAFDVYAVSCSFDLETGDITVITTTTSVGAPIAIAEGDNCLDVVKVLKENDCKRSELIPFEFPVLSPARAGRIAQATLDSRFMAICP